MIAVKLVEQVKKIQNDDAYKRFVELLEEMFEFDKGDLDFGIYRILNTRKDKIHDFIYGVGQYDKNGLPQQIVESMSVLNDKDDETLKKELDAKILQCKELGMSDEQINNTKGIIELRNQLNSGKDILSLQIEIYNILYDFFSKYYDKGDFISKRRYKKDIYALPYNGEEVKLSWANEDQYYIKTVNNYNNYVFKDDKENGEWTIEFKVVNALYEKDNNKENTKRVFMLYDKKLDNNEEKKDTFTIDKENKKVVISFVYDVPSEKYKSDIDKEGNSKVTFKNVVNNSNYKIIEEYIKNNLNEIYDKLFAFDGKVVETSLFGKHLVRFYAKNQFDFFIHKDLKVFLNRELDNYIKTELVNIDDIDESTKCNDLENILVKIKVVKKIAKVIIDELAEIEDFQKVLYLKKKFVVDTNYIITLDNILNKELKNEICKNKEQRSDWVENFDAKEIIERFDKSNDLDDKDLNKLLVDTKYFDEEIKEKILDEIENIDNKIKGIMFNGDNEQILNIISNKYYNNIKFCYIDPPYNTEQGEFLYKDNYKNSSWLSMMYKRLMIVKNMLNSNGVIFISIDDHEFNNLYHICQYIYGNNNVDVMIWRKSGASRDGKMKNTTTFRKDHEYLIVIFNNNKTLNKSFEKPNWLNEYGNPDNDPRGNYKSGLCYKTNANTNSPNYYTVISPSGKEITKQFDISKEEFERLNADNRIYWGKNGDSMPNIKIFEEEERDVTTSSMLFDSYEKITTIDDLSCTTTKGSKELDNIIGITDIGKKMRPKPLALTNKLIQIGTQNEDIIIDFFAGTGTTGCSCIYNNRKFKEKNNKFILCEMGTYFSSILITRIKKAIYCDTWENGIPQNRNTGISQIIKYQKVESYDDTLNNIKINNIQSFLNDGNLIKYTFDSDLNTNILDIDQFKNPFDYKMVIQMDNELKETNIDLIETFNYLIGLYVDRSYALCKVEDIKFKLIIGNLRLGEKVAIIWREIKDIKESNDILNKFIDEKYDLIKDVDILYINGDSSIKKLNLCDKVKIIETKFKAEMFDIEE